MYSTKKTIVSVIFYLIIVTAISATETGNKESVIGVYDSRSIAIAYCGSDEFRNELKALKQKYNSAKEHNNKKMMKKYSNEGKELQELFHKQAFGTYPVNNILEKIKEKIPKIKKETGVSIIVSKWNKQKLSKYKNDTQINITENLIKAFNPDEKQYQRAIEIQKKEPVSKFTLFMMELFH